MPKLPTEKTGTNSSANLNAALGAKIRNHPPTNVVVQQNDQKKKQTHNVTVYVTHFEVAERGKCYAFETSFSEQLTAQTAPQ